MLPVSLWAHADNESAKHIEMTMRANRREVTKLVIASLLGSAPETVPNIIAANSRCRNLGVELIWLYTYEHLLLLSFWFVVKTAGQPRNHDIGKSPLFEPPGR